MALLSPFVSSARGIPKMEKGCKGKEMTVFYRISDKGRPKEKLANAGKLHCLDNAVQEFGKESLMVLADNCNPETVDEIRARGLTFEETSLGNAGSLQYLLELVGRLPDDEAVYLLEDDYLHRQGSKRVLLEGLEIADYVTLYDHPDKYRTAAKGGNPFNFAALQKNRIYLTASSHWRETNSTPMTFACRAGTLKEDMNVWQKHQRKKIPKSFRVFMELTQNAPADAIRFLLAGKRKYFFVIMSNWLLRRRMRRLISAIPAYATHAETEWLAPIIDWSTI
jgi:hypothetical protein